MSLFRPFYSQFGRFGWAGPDSTSDLFLVQIVLCTHIYITEIWVHQVHILRRDRVHICTHFSIILFTATSYFMIKHALKMIYLKYMHIKKKRAQICTRFST